METTCRVTVVMLCPNILFLNQEWHFGNVPVM